MTREDDELLAEFFQNSYKRFIWPTGQYATLDNIEKIPARTMVVWYRKFKNKCTGC